MSEKRASALEAEATATRTSDGCDDDHGVRDARVRRDAAAEERDVIREAFAMANEAVKDAIDGKTAMVENSMEFIKVARAESDADYAREESARLEKEVDLLRAALSAKETEYANALQAMIAALETEGQAQAALKAISGDADAVVVEAEAEATALSTELQAAEDKALEASRALDAAETAKEKAHADANRRADEAAAAAKEIKDAAATAAVAAVLVVDARAEETAANEAFRRLETDVEAASVAAVAASVTRSQSTMDKAIGSTPESLRKSAAVRRAESEKLAAEAETEEDAKKLAAASKDFKTAATKSRRAKDLRERAAAAASEAEEMEASAAEMATNAAAKEGAGDEAGKEDEKEALNPTEVFRALNAKLKAAEVESWRARRRRVLAESGLEPEDSPASCALRAAADVLEKRIARREAEIAEDAE